MKFNEQADTYADIMTLVEWVACVKAGCFIPDDGVGFWGTASHYNQDADSFNLPPKGATHVHWYNK